MSSEKLCDIDEKLKSIGFNVNLSEGPPINQKRTVTFINHFVVTISDFLNNFAKSCEGKLFECDQKLRRLEDELCLVEAKLNSIPGVNSAPSQQTDKEPVVEAEASSLEKTTEVEEPNETESSTQPEEKEKEVNPALVKYLKMVQFGVPVQAVKLKMVQEGLDPNLLGAG